uniref:Gypsy retrotransposon integrase-like protein 1 n=1 Tax=Pelusios castaneus TaxID=367368 RepID=A0A8C8RYW9_9SAUR
MVVDYRKLNNITRKDAYPLPRIEETFALLAGSKWFSVLDLKSGYYQVPVEPADRSKTAFTTPFGNWQFRMMPQGLTNAPATFQRMMERVMSGMNLTEVVAFLDDLIIFSSTLEEHEERLLKVLKRLQEYGLKLAPSKCKLFQTSVKYLGHEEKKEEYETRLYLREWPKLFLSKGVLYRKAQRRGENIEQLVIPYTHRDRALEGIHDEMGHLGTERTLELARDRFYWPRMTKAVERKCQECERCIRRKARVEKAAELVNIKAYAPMELVCIDFLTLEPDASGTKNILVVTDHFTKYAQAYPTKDQTARTVASVLWENFINHYGFPRRIHSDQGANFESELINELSKISGVKSRTTPYHPRGNPVERFNRTLLNMLGTLEEHKKTHWKKYVKPLVHAYNCTRNDTTGHSPYFLMFGRQPILPIDLCFGIKIRGRQEVAHQEYVKDLRCRLRYAYDLAAKESERSQLTNKSRWDAKIIMSSIEPGDRVLVRNLSLRGKQKLADRWEPVVHVVLEQLKEDIPVYKVQAESGDGPIRVLHRDMLRPCGYISSHKSVEDNQSDACEW